MTVQLYKYALAVLLATAATGAHAVVTVTVDSAQYWNDGGVDMVEGVTYSIQVTPPDQTWYDASIESTAAGYDIWYMRAAQLLARQPSDLLYSLIGCYGNAEDDASNCFLIGTGIQLVATKSGRLYMYANDVPHFYFNNRGQLTVQITATPNDSD